MENRIIKFRAFTQEGEMIPVGDIEFFTTETYRVNGEIPIGNGKLMQFTGLTDRNGKEIYEGDLVKGKVWDWKEERISKVEFDDIFCGYMPFVEEHDTCEDSYRLQPNEVEVIGNIYQDKNLIE